MNRSAMMVSWIAAAIGVALLWSYKVRFENETRGGNLIAVAVALADVPMGTPVNAGVLGAKPVPAAYVDTRQVRWEDRERIAGVRVTGYQKQQSSIVPIDAQGNPIVLQRIPSLLVAAGT